MESDREKDEGIIFELVPFVGMVPLFHRAIKLAITNDCSKESVIETGKLVAYSAYQNAWTYSLFYAINMSS